MGKQFFIIYLFLFLCCNVQATNNDTLTDCQRMGFAGPVKYIKTSIACTQVQVPIPLNLYDKLTSLPRTYTALFNQQGSLLEKTDNISQMKNTYNEKGKILQSSVETFPNNPDFCTDPTYVIERIARFGVVVTHYIYDSTNERLLEKQVHDSVFRRTQISRYTYYPQGSLETETRTDKYGNNESIYKQTYNEQGWLICDETKYGGLTINNKIEHKYNEKGLLIESTVYKEDEVVGLGTNTYNSMGKMTESTYSEPNNPLFDPNVTVCRYNNKGNIIERLQYNLSSTDKHYTKEYWLYNKKGIYTKYQRSVVDDGKEIVEELKQNNPTYQTEFIYRYNAAQGKLLLYTVEHTTKKKTSLCATYYDQEGNVKSEDCVIKALDSLWEEITYKDTKSSFQLTTKKVHYKDRYGNIVRIETFYNDKLASVISCDIKYYEN